MCFTSQTTKPQWNQGMPARPNTDFLGGLRGKNPKMWFQLCQIEIKSIALLSSQAIPSPSKEGAQHPPGCSAVNLCSRNVYTCITDAQQYVFILVLDLCLVSGLLLTGLCVTHWDALQNSVLPYSCHVLNHFSWAAGEKLDINKRSSQFPNQRNLVKNSISIFIDCPGKD